MLENEATPQTRKRNTTPIFRTQRSTVRYRVVDQRRFDVLNIQDLKTGLHFQLHADFIVLNRQLIRGFCSEDAMLIGFIAGQAFGQERYK